MITELLDKSQLGKEKMKYLLIALCLISTSCFAEETLQQRLEIMIGKLVIENLDLATKIENLNKINIDLKKQLEDKNKENK